MAKRLLQSFWTTDVKVDDAGWEKLEAAGAISLTGSARSRLISEMNDYRENIDGYDAAVRPGKVRPLLIEFSDALRDLDAVLTNLLGARSPEQRSALHEIQRAATRDHTQIAGRKAVEELRANLKPWSRFATAAIDGLPPDAGAPGNPFLGGLLLRALAVFHESGGKGTYTSNATAFLKSVCDLVSYPVQSDAALHQALKQALSTARKKVRENAST